MNLLNLLYEVNYGGQRPYNHDIFKVFSVQSGKILTVKTVKEQGAAVSGERRGNTYIPHSSEEEFTVSEFCSIYPELAHLFS